MKKYVFECIVKQAPTTEIPNEITLAAMEAAEKDEDMHEPFDSVEKLMEALNA